MPWIRKLVYRMGFRPKLGSIFHSPSWIDPSALQETWDDFFSGVQKAQEETASFPNEAGLGRLWDAVVETMPRVYVDDLPHHMDMEDGVYYVFISTPRPKPEDESTEKI